MNPRLKYIAVPRSLLRRMIAGAERNIKFKTKSIEVLSREADYESRGYYRGRRDLARELLMIADAVPPVKVFKKSVDANPLSDGVAK